jgi:hypothetical protein
VIYEYQFLIALLITIVVETACLFLIIRVVYKKNSYEISNSLLFFLGIFCNTTTLPYLWFILPIFIKTRAIYVVVGESAVVIAEAIVYYFVLRMGIRKSLIISFFCNAASFLIGLLIPFS